MNLIREYSSIVKSKDLNRLVDFLRPLDKSEREELLPRLTEFEEHYNVVQKLSANTYGFRGDWADIIMLEASALIIADRRFYEKRHWSISVEVFDAIAPWGIPGWIDSYVKAKGADAFRSSNPFSLWSYDRMMTWVEKGYISMPATATIAQLLSLAVRDVEVLGRREVTLGEHFWYLFDYDGSQAQIDTHSFEDGWKKIEPYSAIKPLLESGRLDRQRLLSEAVAASNKGLKRDLGGWFAGMVAMADPTADEVSALQEAMFAVFTSPHPRPVGVMLDVLRRIADDSRFAAYDFLMQSAAIFASGVKTNISKAITLVAKLSGTGRVAAADIAAALSVVFINPDETLQIKAAKVIAKAGILGDAEAISVILSPYAQTMMSTARGLLAGLINMDGAESATDTADSSIDGETGDECGCPAPLVPFEPVRTFDDFLFLSSKVLESPSVTEVDMFIEASLRFGLEGGGYELSRLEPVLLMADANVRTYRPGVLGRMVARYIMAYCRVLIARYPREASRLAEVCGQAKIDNKPFSRLRCCDIMRPTKAVMQHVLDVLEPPATVADSDVPASKGFFSRLFRRRKKERLEEIPVVGPVSLPEVQDVDRVLLSTMTHRPGYVSPEALVRRLGVYVDGLSEPDTLDMQIAISRLAPVDCSDALTAVGAWPDCEIKRLMTFLLGPADARPCGPYDHRAWWIMAGLVKSPSTVYREFDTVGSREYLTGGFKWEVLRESRTYYGSKYISHILRLDGADKVVPGFLIDEPLLVDIVFRGIPDDIYDISEPDLDQVIWQIPSAPESLLASWTNSGFSDSSDTQTATVAVRHAALRVLGELRHGWNEPSYLLLAAGMLTADSTSRAFAAGVWARRVSCGEMDDALLGSMLGRIEAGEWSPLKRFTDLMAQHMCGHGAIHDRALARLLVAMVGGMALKPLPGTRNLLTALRELLDSTGLRIESPATVSRLESWSANSALRSVVGTLLTKYCVAECTGSGEVG